MALRMWASSTANALRLSSASKTHLSSPFSLSRCFSTGNFCSFLLCLQTVCGNACMKLDFVFFAVGSRFRSVVLFGCWVCLICYLGMIKEGIFLFLVEFKVCWLGLQFWMDWSMLLLMSGWSMRVRLLLLASLTMLRCFLFFPSLNVH